MVAGKALMDRHCPEYLRDTPETGYWDSSRADGALGRCGASRLRDHAPLRRHLVPGATRARRQAGPRAPGRAYSQPRCGERQGGGLGAGALSRCIAATSTSTTASACCGRARCTRTAYTSTRRTGGGWPAPAPRQRSARHRISSWEAASSTWRPPTTLGSRSASGPTWAAGRASACCGRLRKPTRSRS